MPQRYGHRCHKTIKAAVLCKKIKPQTPRKYLSNHQDMVRPIISCSLGTVCCVHSTDSFQRISKHRSECCKQNHTIFKHPIHLCSARSLLPRAG